MNWHYFEHDGYSDIDQSTSAEAFVSGNLRDTATALVRESLQNVLDARSDKAHGPVRVRMSLGEVDAEIAMEWFAGLEKHLAMPDAGLPDAPMPDEPCRTLAIEDFETTGLTGDYTRKYKQGEQNNFVNFLYHDGVTGKVGKNLGSRGVGKIVLLMASRARTIFAYTIRDSDAECQPLLVGKNLLKYRTDENGQGYAPKSYFVASWPRGAAREPVTDPTITTRFADDFSLHRGNMSGLSILIPYLDPSINAQTIRRAVIAEYHYAILSGRLVVELDDNGQCETFDAEHLPETGEQSVDAMIRLVRWAVESPEASLSTEPPPPGEPQRLDETLVTDTTRQAINDAFDARQPIAVRLPLHVHPREQSPVQTYVTTYLEFAEHQHDKPAFIREVLPVTDVRSARAAPQVRALVVIEDDAILKLLRAAEGANHTDWSPRTDQFMRDYIGRRSEIEFVATAVQKLVDIIRGEATEPVGGIATRFFSAAMPDTKPKTKGEGKDKVKGAEAQDVPDDLEENPGAPYLLTKTKDGFTISRNPKRARPKRLTVRVAYDVLRGSPWSKTAYDPADFDFRKNRGPVSVAQSDKKVRVEKPDPGNRLIIYPLDDDFEVIVHGFDPVRDLIVDVRDTTPRQQPSDDVGTDEQNDTPSDAEETTDERTANQLHATQPSDT